MGHKRLTGQPAGQPSSHIAVRLSDADRAWVKAQATAKGVSEAAILRAGLALLKAPDSAPPDLHISGPAGRVSGENRPRIARGFSGGVGRGGLWSPNKNPRR